MPAKIVANFSTAPATASHASMTLQGCQAVLLGRIAKISEWGVGRVGQGSRCELYRETVNPRGLRPINGTPPKNFKCVL
eukprot:1158301-Pelagomonas_calceolata.AAC.4